MKLKIISPLIFVTVFSYAMSLNSLVVRLASLHFMSDKSDLVIHGYVGNKKVVRDEMGRNITLTEIEVVDGLYGAKTGEVVTIFQVGGSKNGISMPIIGGQEYKVGQEVILFGLKSKKQFVSFGAGQGKFDIVEKGQKRGVQEDLGNVHAIANKKFFKPTPLTYHDVNLLKEEIKLMLKDRK